MSGLLLFPLIAQVLVAWKFWRVPGVAHQWRLLLLSTILLMLPGIWRDLPFLSLFELLLVWIWVDRTRKWGGDLRNLKSLFLLMVLIGFSGFGRFLEFYWIDSSGGVRVKKEGGILSLWKAENGKPMDEGLKIFHFAAPDCRGKGMYLGASNNSVLEYRSYRDGSTIAKHLPAKGRAGSIVHLDCKNNLIFYTDFLNKTLLAADAENLKTMWVSPKLKDKITYIVGKPEKQEIFINHEFSHEIHRIDYSIWPPVLEKLPLKAQAIALDPDGRWLITFWERSFNKFSLPDLKPLGSIPLFKGLKGGEVMMYIWPQKFSKPNKFGLPETVLMSIQGVPGRVKLLDTKKMSWVWQQSVSIGTRYGAINPQKGILTACNFFTGTLSVLDLKDGHLIKKIKGPSRCRRPFLWPGGNLMSWPTKQGIVRLKQTF